MSCSKARHGCVECGQPVPDDEAESTFCGTCHRGCLDDHCSECPVCRNDFFPDWVDGDEEDE